MLHEQVATDTRAVKDFWEDASCGERIYLDGRDKEAYRRHTQAHFEIEPMILDLAQFDAHRGKDVLEIGVGLGADHQRWAEAGVNLSGVDLTERAIEHTRRRLSLFGLHSNLQRADAQKLPFPDASFDIVYSWGVLMCAPDPQRALDEVFRVLRPGGRALLMLYHLHSFVGYMLWTRYALMRGRPWLSLDEIYQQYLESPGTKAYSVGDVRAMMAKFVDVRTRVYLTHADLLTTPVGQRHRGIALSLARRVWPRRLIKTLFPEHGLFMTIDARKP